MKLKMAVLCTALALPGVAVNAKTFNEAGENDISTRDIHSQNNTLANGPHVLGRASLVYGNGHSFAIATRLANAWCLSHRKRILGFNRCASGNAAVA